MITDKLTGEINFIVSYFWNGCRTPGQLWVETARPIAGRIALVFLSSDWSDIVTKFFRPKGLRQSRHGRKRKAGKLARASTSPHDLIAVDFEVVREAFFGEPTSGTRFLWRSLNVIEGISWNVAVISMSKDLVFESILGILRLDATDCSTPGRALVQGQDFAPFNNGASYIIPMPQIDYIEAPCTYNNSIVSATDAKKYQVLADVTAYNEGTTDGDFQLEFFVVGGPDAGLYIQPYRALGPGETANGNISLQITAPFSLRWEQRSHGPLIFPGASISIVPSFW